MNLSFDEMAVEMLDEGLESRSEEFGDMVISHVRLPANFDPSHMFAALPKGVCPIPHWGRVLTGELHLRYADGTEEITREGDFFYWPPGHTIWTGARAWSGWTSLPSRRHVGSTNCWACE